MARRSAGLAGVPFPWCIISTYTDAPTALFDRVRGLLFSARQEAWQHVCDAASGVLLYLGGTAGASSSQLGRQGPVQVGTQYLTLPTSQTPSFERLHKNNEQGRCVARHHRKPLWLCMMPLPYAGWACQAGALCFCQLPLALAHNLGDSFSLHRLLAVLESSGSQHQQEQGQSCGHRWCYPATQLKRRVDSTWCNRFLASAPPASTPIVLTCRQTAHGNSLNSTSIPPGLGP